MTKTSPLDNLAAYEHTVLGRSGTLEERKAWLEEHGIDDFKQMLFSEGKHYYIFRNSEDALRFKVVWG